MINLHGTTADDVWLAAAKHLARDGLQQPSRGGATKEALHVALTVGQPRERWVLSRRPAINPAFALAEVVWILSGRNDSAFLKFWNPALPKYAGAGPTFAGAYGERLRHGFSVDQIERAYRALRDEPDSRQVVLQIWDPRTDLPIDGGTPRSKDVPCNLCSILKVRGGCLHWTQIMRSNDLVLGWPHNVVQFTTLQEMMAGWLGLGLGAYHHWSDSLHAYTNETGGVDFDRQPIPPNTDRWDMSYEETHVNIAELARRMDRMAECALDGSTLTRFTTGHQFKCQAATNLLRIVGADAARRLGEVNLAAELAGECTNPVLKMAWGAWYDRCSKRQK